MEINNKMTESEGLIELMRAIDVCCLPKLLNECDVGDHHARYRAHANSLRGRVGALRRRLSETDVSRYSPETRVEVVSAVLVLIHELRSKGPWSPEGYASYAQSIEEAFTGNSKVSLDRFAQDAGEYKQAIFDTYLANLHKKLTADDWKKYPATIEVYTYFLNHIQEYHNHVELDPVKILPAALHIIDDFNPTFKPKGLESCLSVLKCVNQESFKSSNYQQVIYEILKKGIHDADLDIVKLTFHCMIQLIPLFPPPVGSQWNQFDTLLKDVIDDIYLQTSIEKKAVCLEFVSKLIAIRRVHCVRCKKSLNLVICENLDLCTAEHVRRLLLPNLLLTIKMWLKYCWVIWSYELDKKIISLLLKLLYIQCHDKVSKKKMDDLEAIIVCTIALCTNAQQDSILNDLRVGESAIENEAFKERLKHIRSSLKPRTKQS